MRIRRFTIETRVRVSRNYQSAEAGAAVEIVFDEAEAPATVADALRLTHAQREHLKQEVVAEADAVLQTL